MKVSTVTQQGRPAEKLAFCEGIHGNQVLHQLHQDHHLHYYHHLVLY
jgi:hypothetical protein